MSIPQNPQEYLDELVRRSKEGLFPSMRLSETFLQCAYRGADGRKCAYGVLIPDEAYRPEFEGAPVVGLAHDGHFEPPEWGGENRGLRIGQFSRVQRIHDNMAYSAEGWSHHRFVDMLLDSPLFKGLKPSVA